MNELDRKAGIRLYVKVSLITNLLAGEIEMDGYEADLLNRQLDEDQSTLLMSSSTWRKEDENCNQK